MGPLGHYKGPVGVVGGGRLQRQDLVDQCVPSISLCVLLDEDTKGVFFHGRWSSHDETGGQDSLGGSPWDALPRHVVSSARWAGVGYWMAGGVLQTMYLASRGGCLDALGEWRAVPECKDNGTRIWMCGRLPGLLGPWQERRKELTPWKYEYSVTPSWYVYRQLTPMHRLYTSCTSAKSALCQHHNNIECIMSHMMDFSAAWSRSPAIGPLRWHPPCYRPLSHTVPRRRQSCTPAILNSNLQLDV